MAQTYGGEEQLWSIDGILNGTEPYGDVTTSVSTTNGWRSDTLRYNSGITVFRAPNLIDTVNYMLGECPALEEVYLPKVVSAKSNFCAWSSNLRLVDFGSVTDISNNGTFYNCRKLNILIIRTDSVCTLPTNGNKMTSTPILTGTGVVYVPQALVESYKVTDGWATCYNNGTQFLPIEGSEYE